jgi:hypothetical protein
LKAVDRGQRALSAVGLTGDAVPTIDEERSMRESPLPITRRSLLGVAAAGAASCIGLLGVARAADAPLLDPGAPEAKVLKYVEDASAAKEALRGSTCANCALYQGKGGAALGACQMFPGKQVKAAGWCKSWAPQM